ncbi:heavy-metal-associated domain-containing protein [Kribbella sp. NPDC056951]|uniref:heavy-metal-associated domain-containing protein n=1 Tax=Kribbella sp. NPDC056951 TaxID=3345978 RepID=UPI00362F839F
MIFEITGMHCSSCGLLVDDAIEDIAGVFSSTTDTRTGRTVVDGIVAPASVTAAIESVGYTARLLTV